MDWLQEAAVSVAEIGDGVEGEVRRSLAEDDVERQQIVDRARRIADGAGESLSALRRKPPAVEGRIERDVAGAQRAWGGVANRFADPEILEIPSAGPIRWGSRAHQGQ